VQSVSEGFLKLEDVFFGEGVEDAIDVLVGEDCERHLECFSVYTAQVLVLVKRRDAKDVYLDADRSK
jgi:hypothetical protein